MMNNFFPYYFLQNRDEYVKWKDIYVIDISASES